MQNGISLNMVFYSLFCLRILRVWVFLAHVAQISLLSNGIKTLSQTRRTLQFPFGLPFGCSFFAQSHIVSWQSVSYKTISEADLSHSLTQRRERLMCCCCWLLPTTTTTLKQTHSRKSETKQCFLVYVNPAFHPCEECVYYIASTKRRANFHFFLFSQHILNGDDIM